jgi:hypothetical protein
MAMDHLKAKADSRLELMRIEISEIQKYSSSKNIK